MKPRLEWRPAEYPKHVVKILLANTHTHTVVLCVLSVRPAAQSLDQNIEIDGHFYLILSVQSI